MTIAGRTSSWPVPVSVSPASSMVLSGLSVFFLWFVHERWQNILMSCIFGAVSTIGFNALDVLQTELFPTDVRSVTVVVVVAVVVAFLS